MPQRSDILTSVEQSDTVNRLIALRPKIRILHKKLTIKGLMLHGLPLRDVVFKT